MTDASVSFKCPGCGRIQWVGSGSANGLPPKCSYCGKEMRKTIIPQGDGVRQPEAPAGKRRANGIELPMEYVPEELSAAPVAGGFKANGMPTGLKIVFALLMLAQIAGGILFWQGGMIACLVSLLATAAVGTWIDDWYRKANRDRHYAEMQIRLLERICRTL